MDADSTLRTDVAELKTEVADLRVDMLERLEKLETRLLTEIHSYARAMESRMHVYEAQSASVAERFAAIETRVRELESKLETCCHLHLSCYSPTRFFMGSSINSISPFIADEQGRNAMLNSVGSWLCIMALVVGPYSIGVFFEGKLARANRELGSRLLRRY